MSPDFFGNANVFGYSLIFLYALSILALTYTFVGYPLLLILLGKLRSRPIQRRHISPRVVVIIVVHNGERLIEQKLITCFAQEYPAAQLRVLVVSDGSTDRTCDIVEEFKKKCLSTMQLTLLALPERRGKAACLNDAAIACDEEIFVFTDARQALHKLAVRSLVDNFSDSEVGAASGQLVFEKEGMTDFGAGMDAYWRYEKFLRKSQSRTGSMVGVTGALYALRRQYFRPIPQETILDDVLIPMNVVMQGKRVIFENDALAYDKPSRNIAHEKTRKVRTLAGNFQLILKHPKLLNPWRNSIAIHFFSHKLMRLTTPLALLTAFVTNIFLVARHDELLFKVTLTLQGLGYGAAVVGFILPQMKKSIVFRLPMAFLSLNWFVVLGFVDYFSNREVHLWKSNAGNDSTVGKL